MKTVAVSYWDRAVMIFCIGRGFLWPIASSHPATSRRPVLLALQTDGQADAKDAYAGAGNGRLGCAGWVLAAGDDGTFSNVCGKNPTDE